MWGRGGGVGTGGNYDVNILRMEQTGGRFATDMFFMHFLGKPICNLI